MKSLHYHRGSLAPFYCFLTKGIRACQRSAIQANLRLWLMRMFATGNDQRTDMNSQSSELYI